MCAEFGGLFERILAYGDSKWLHRFRRGLVRRSGVDRFLAVGSGWVSLLDVMSFEFEMPAWEDSGAW
jgi:hypothetical protein